MTDSVFTPDEHALLEAWFRHAPIDDRIDDLLRAAGFANDGEPYTRLDAWVGMLAVAEIQDRLPNTGILHDAGVQLTRPLRDVPPRKVTGLTRPLFTINWADSGPGVSWPVAYTLVWVPVFDRFVVVASSDGDDAFGYADFALGHFPADAPWLDCAREIIVRDWRGQYERFGQGPWAYLFRAGHVSEQEALAWREEAWSGTEFDERGQDEIDGEEAPESEEGAPAPRTGSCNLGPVTHLRIRLYRWSEFQPTAENDYPAEVIREGDNFIYRAKGVTLPITEYEAKQVVSNPFLYYFSTALKLHQRIERVTEGQAVDGETA